MDQNKITSLEDAAALVASGETLALGGMTLYRRPTAFVRALINAPTPPTDLTMLGFTAGYETDLLIGAGIVSRIRACYCGLEIFGLAPMFTEKAQSGDLTVIEETEASLTFGIRARLAGLNFMPGLGWIGTDLLKLRPDVKVIDDPYQPGQQVVAFPAISWDWAVLHAVKADPSGNALLNGNLGIDAELGIGADKGVIITAEEIVDGFSERVHVTGLKVRAVVHAPQGAWPTSCYPAYAMDGQELLRYIDACNSGAFGDYVAEPLQAAKAL